ncbi:hypothetical protein PAPYR_4663 [Paratrimastix pyriformis]|uniref:G-protein coupled receptors family 2 profile 2 domain-containing protein n=1 Tax=Paratrimastix pyriformis TaxID=342808 RepID=A0ABQ8UM65_9EUKA|nr:hypothetical protein PAPYR_4663 [Paratrimastix pyriformis]
MFILFYFFAALSVIFLIGLGIALCLVPTLRQFPNRIFVFLILSALFPPICVIGQSKTPYPLCITAGILEEAFYLATSIWTLCLGFLLLLLVWLENSNREELPRFTELIFHLLAWLVPLGVNIFLWAIGAVGHIGPGDSCGWTGLYPRFVLSLTIDAPMAVILAANWAIFLYMRCYHFPHARKQSGKEGTADQKPITLRLVQLVVVNTLWTCFYLCYHILTLVLPDQPVIKEVSDVFLQCQGILYPILFVIQTWPQLRPAWRRSRLGRCCCPCGQQGDQPAYVPIPLAGAEEDPGRVASPRRWARVGEWAEEGDAPTRGSLNGGLTEEARLIPAATAL